MVKIDRLSLRVADGSLSLNRNIGDSFISTYARLCRKRGKLQIQHKSSNGKEGQDMCKNKNYKRGVAKKERRNTSNKKVKRF